MIYDAYLLVLLALKEVVTHRQTDGQCKNFGGQPVTKWFEI